MGVEESNERGHQDDDDGREMHVGESGLEEWFGRN